MDNIASARKKTGLSKAEAAKRIGVPKRTWEAWEAGTRKPPSYVERLIVKELQENIKGHRKSRQPEI